MSIEKNTPNFLKHSKNSFTTILNKTIEAIRDPAALGIYLYLASKPHDWQISQTNLRNHFGKGGDFITARLTYLKKLGLLKSVQVRDEKNRIIRWETILFNEIHEATQGIEPPENPKSQEGGNPPSGEPTHVADPPLTNKRIKKIKDNNITHTTREAEKSKFEEFWELYPIHKAKDLCKQRWHNKKLDKIADEIISKLKVQIEHDDQWRQGFIPNPSTYLNQERWNDDIAKPIKKSNVKPERYTMDELMGGVI